MAITQPWLCVCVDLIGPYTINPKDGTVLDVMCLTMIDPATGWFKIIELLSVDITCMHKGEEITEVIIDKSSATMSLLFSNLWLSCYPRASFVIYDNGSEFKLHFEALCNSNGLVHKPTRLRIHKPMVS